MQSFLNTLWTRYKCFGWRCLHQLMGGHRLHISAEPAHQQLRWARNPKDARDIFPFLCYFPAIKFCVASRFSFYLQLSYFPIIHGSLLKKNPEPLSSWYSTSGVYLCLFIDAEHLYIRRLPTLNASPRYLFGPSKTRGGNL